MRIILSNVIKIEEPTDEVRKYCIKYLTFKNPEVEKKRRMGFYAYGMPREIKLYNEYEGNLYVPYGFFSKLWSCYPIPANYFDYTTVKSIDVNSHIVLRDYQQFGLNALKKYHNGLFILPCGMGKTQLGLECGAYLKQKTLWLCHTKDLAKQAMDRCVSNIDCKVSMISEGKCDVSGDYVFATIQTLVNVVNNGEIRQDEFGLIVGDEIQHLATNPTSMQMYRTCLDYFSARYKLGLTATCHRADGLEKCISLILGDVIYEIKKMQDEYACVYENKVLLTFPLSKFQVPARVYLAKTNYDISNKDVYAKNGGTIQFTKLISDIANDVERNNLILDRLHKVEGSTIILSDRVSQLKYLCSHVENGVEIDGSTPRKVREKALDDVRCGRVKYLFASYQLAKEGLDCTILSNLVMASPVKDYTVVVQSIGRIMRPYEGKTVANVYDYLDPVGMLYGFYTKRRRHYIKNDWEVIDV